MNIIELTKIVQEIYFGVKYLNAESLYLKKKGLLPNSDNQNSSSDEYVKGSHLVFIEEQKIPFSLSTSTKQKWWDGILEYSTNANDWKEWNGEEVNSSPNGILYLRGTGNTYITGKTAWRTFVLNDEGKIKCKGNIETLLDYKMVEKGEHPCMSGDYSFGCLFESCKTLTEAPDLPMMDLTIGCYSKMFYGCTSLKKAPELPATQLSIACYDEMFSYCKSLTTVPKTLPAKTLEKYCYRSMFLNCSSIKETPDILAESIAIGGEECCYSMFSGCSSLIKIPNKLLPMNLEKQCYYHMFKDCASLTEVAEDFLPATEMAEECYMHLFSGCSSLKKIPKLPATKLAKACYLAMFYSCKELEKIPEDYLPATELATKCYFSMFENDTSLSIAPSKLPATTLAANCYFDIFTGCTSLTATIHCPASVQNDPNNISNIGELPNSVTVVYDL